MQRRHLIAATCAAPLLPRFAFAAETALRVLVGATPGGGTDLIARAVAQEFRVRLNRTVTVENRPGAAGNIAAATVVKEADTLLLCYASHAINPSLFPTLPFHPMRDFTPLSLIAKSPMLLVVKPDSPANNFAELQALAKKRQMSIGVGGLGSVNHLAGEMMKKQGGMDLLSVPYKGTGPALVDVMGGVIDMVLSNVASAQELVEGKRLKVIAVSTAQRVPAYPNAEPIADVLPGFDYVSWYGLLGSAGMKPQDAEAIAAAARATVASEAMRKHLRSEGMDPVGSSPAEFSRFLLAEVERWRKVVALTGAKAA